MKVFEKILDKRLRQLVCISDTQFAYRRGKSCTDAIFVIRRLQENYMEKNKKLFHIFVDLQKAFDRIPREVIRWALRRQMVTESLIDLVMSLYDDTRSRVCVAGGTSEEFNVKVGVHQGSSLSPLLFILVMEEATKDCRRGELRELLYADDLVLTGESKEEVEQMFKDWKREMESKGLKVNIEKTKMMISGNKEDSPVQTGRYPCGVCGRGVGVNSILCHSCGKWCHKRCSKRQSLDGATSFRCPACLRSPNQGEEKAVKCIIDGDEIEMVKDFCYLGDVLCCEGGADRAVKARISAAWRKWRDLASLLKNRHVPLKYRGSIYNTCIRPVLLYGSESWSLTKRLEHQLLSCDRRMLPLMCGVSLSDRVENSAVAGRCHIAPLEASLRERRLRWFGHVKRRNGEGAIGRVLETEVSGSRPRGRPKKSWISNIKEDMKELGLTEHDCQDRNRWKNVITSNPQKRKRRRQTEKVKK